MAKMRFNGNKDAKGQGFDGNPQNINTNGSNRKSFASINNELEAKGVQRLTKKDLIKAYELIFNTDEKELETISKADNTPYGLKLIIKELNNTKSRSKALADYRDYMFGKAQNNVDVTSGGDKISTEPVQINFVTTKEEEKGE